MNELTLVTAFFDLGRGQDKNQQLRRTNERYFKEFEHWARIQNPLVIYTDPDSAVSIRKIREKFGRADNTTIIEVEDFLGLEGDLLQRMLEVSQNNSFRQFRYFEDAFSNNGKYDYIWMMKYWFMNDANQRGLLGEQVAWFDFGFDHGGKCFSHPEDFDFLWKHPFEKKIHLFCLYSPDTITAMESLQFLDDCVMGVMICLPREYTKKLWELVRKAMEALLMLQCIDDDQQLLLMAYKEEPTLFQIHISTWFVSLKENGGEHMRLKESAPQKNPSILRKIRNGVGGLRRKDPKKEYCKRCFERASKFH